MKTYNRTFLSTVLLAGVVTFCSLTVNAANLSAASPLQHKMASDTTKMKKGKMKMEKKKMKKVKMSKDTISKM